MWSLQNQEKLTNQNEENPTSTSLRLSEVKSSSVLPQPARCQIKKNRKEFSPATLPSEPAKLWLNAGRHAGAKEDRSTCSPESKNNNVLVEYE